MKEWMKDNVSASIAEQFWLIAISFFAGIVLGVLYDFFRGIRRVRQLKKTKEDSWKVQLEDGLFLLAYVAITYWILYHYHYGQVAGYVYLGEALGVILYYKLLHNWGRCFFTCVLWQICTVMLWVFGIIALPFRVICGKIIKLLKSLVKSIKIIFINH